MKDNRRVVKWETGGVADLLLCRGTFFADFSEVHLHVFVLQFEPHSIGLWVMGTRCWNPHAVAKFLNTS